MLRILLTSDNHIGLKYAGYEQSALLAQERLTAFADMVDIANRHACDLFVIAGDLFENTYSVPKRDITRLFEILSGFRGTVAVLPGNHDYYDNDVKVWQYVRDAMAKTDNVMLLSEFRPYAVSIGEQQAILYPALCTTLHSQAGENNLERIAHTVDPDIDAYHIGIAHGAVEGETIDSEGRYFLMTRQELCDIPVDVWLIGHTHVPFPRDIGEEFAVTSERVFNAGTHVQTDVSCNTVGCCFILEMDDDKTIRAKSVQSGHLHFMRIPVTLQGGTMEQTLHAVLDPLDDHTVVELILSGAVSDEEYAARDALVTGMLARFVEGRYHDHALSRMITAELIRREFSETSFSAKFLESLLEEPKEAQLMYELLQTLQGGA